MNNPPPDPEPEMQPDAWDRFENAFDKVVKAPLPPKASAPPPQPEKRGRGRPRKA